MPTIFLVRHGENQDNLEGLLNGHRDRPLTDFGREQAAATAEKLAGLGIQVIYASPLIRAYETATIIAARLNLPVTVENDLIERDFGILTGQPVATILNLPPENVLHTEMVEYFLEAEGAEDFPTLYLRGQKVLKKIQGLHPDENVLLVTHGDIGKMIQAAYHGWDWKTGLLKPYFGHAEVLELRNA